MTETPGSDPASASHFRAGTDEEHDMKMYIVWCRESRTFLTDAHGHVKVYTTKIAAQRRARSENGAVYPRMTRWITRPCEVVLLAPAAG